MTLPRKLPKPKTLTAADLAQMDLDEAEQREQQKLEEAAIERAADLDGLGRAIDSASAALQYAREALDGDL